MTWWSVPLCGALTLLARHVGGLAAGVRGRALRQARWSATALTAMCGGGLLLAFASSGTGLVFWRLAVGTGFLCLFFFYFAHRVLRISRYCNALLDPRREPRARHLLMAYAEGKLESPVSASAFSAVLVQIAHGFVVADRTDDALALLERIPLQDASRSTRELAVLVRVLANLRLENVSVARGALDAAEGPKDQLPLVEGLVLSYEGRGSEALDVVSRAEATFDSEYLRNEAHFVRAHAYAVMGDVAKAEQALQSWADAHGFGAVRVVAKRGGPVAAVATALVTSLDSRARAHSHEPPR